MPGVYVLRDDSYDYDDQEGEREIVQQGTGKGEANRGKEGDMYYLKKNPKKTDRGKMPQPHVASEADDDWEHWGGDPASIPAAHGLV